MPTPKGYSLIQIALHWIVALLVLIQLLFGEEIAPAFRALKRTGSASYDFMTLLHCIHPVKAAYGSGLTAVFHGDHLA